MTTPLCGTYSQYKVHGVGNALITTCEHHRETMYKAKYLNYDIKWQNSYTHKNLTRITHFYFNSYRSIISGHLEQLAIANPNLQELI